jgi:ABC-type uncharacterized transport system permease subunit
MLQATMVRAVPIALGGLAGVLSERVAVVNIAIEGMLLAGAFTGALMGSLLGGWGGLVGRRGRRPVRFHSCRAGGDLPHGPDHRRRGDQPLRAGADKLCLEPGLRRHTAFSTTRRFSGRWKIPFLGDIPVIGPMLFNQNLFVYGALIMVAWRPTTCFIHRSGLRARAVGEHPRAADTLGINVYTTRYIHVTLGGMVAGFGGAWFTLGSVGRFDENMTGGRGFIGLAAMIFGRWHPVGALMAALVFGFADSLQQKLALLRTPIPSEFLAMAPYIATIDRGRRLVGRAAAGSRRQALRQGMTVLRGHPCAVFVPVCAWPICSCRLRANAPPGCPRHSTMSRSPSAIWIENHSLAASSPMA